MEADLTNSCHGYADAAPATEWGRGVVAEVHLKASWPPTADPELPRRLGPA